MSVHNNTTKSSYICKECGGFCCLYQLFEIDINDQRANEFWNKRAKFLDTINEKHVYRAWQPCPQLDMNTKLCTIYDNRPEVCRKFPKVGGANQRLWKHFCPLLKELGNGFKY